jgi:hypothetical protein
VGGHVCGYAAAVLRSPVRQLAIMLGAFAVGAAIAGALGAVNLGVALGVGQVCFAAALALVLLS